MIQIFSFVWCYSPDWPKFFLFKAYQLNSPFNAGSTYVSSYSLNKMKNGKHAKAHSSSVTRKGILVLQA